MHNLSHNLTHTKGQQSIEAVRVFKKVPTEENPPRRQRLTPASSGDAGIPVLILLGRCDGVVQLLVQQRGLAACFNSTASLC